jgi:anti-anti-sigma factor
LGDAKGGSVFGTFDFVGGHNGASAFRACACWQLGQLAGGLTCLIVDRFAAKWLASAAGQSKIRITMDIRNIVTGESCEMLISGRIDGAGANQLEVEIISAIRSGTKNIYVNLDGATFLCSAGLRVLLQYWRQMKNSGRVLLATRPSPEVDAVLATSGFREVLVEKV